MRKALTILLLCLAATTASASDLAIMPLGARTVEADARHMLTLTNRGDESVKMQVRAYAWSQVDGKDVLVPTTDLIATPGVVELAPGEKGVARIQRVGAGHSFRVLLTELPKPITDEATAVGFRFEYSLPYLFEPAGAGPAVIDGKTVGGRLVLTNMGGKAAKITAVGPVNSKAWAAKVPNAGWILPGATMAVDVPEQAGQLALTVDGATRTLTVQ